MLKCCHWSIRTEEFWFLLRSGIDGSERVCRQERSDAFVQHRSSIFNQENKQTEGARRCSARHAWMNSVMEEKTCRRSYGASEFLHLIVVPVFISWFFISDATQSSVITGYSLWSIRLRWGGSSRNCTNWSDVVLDGLRLYPVFFICYIITKVFTSGGQK